MAEHEVTLGEVYRAIVEVRQEQREMRRDLVGRAEYESDQEGIERQFRATQVVHNRLEGDIKALAARTETAEKEQRAAKSRWVQALSIAVLGSVLAVMVPLLLRGVMG